MLKRIWSKISYHHLKKDMDRIETAKGKIVNQYTFFILIAFFYLAFRELVLGYVLSFYLAFTLSCLSLLLFVFTKVRFSVLYVTIILSGSSIVVFGYSSYFTFTHGVSSYCLSLFAIMSFYIFYIQQKKDILCGVILVVEIILFLFLLCLKYNFNFNIYYETNGRYIQISEFSHVVLFIVLNSYYIIKRGIMVTEIYQQLIRSEELVSDLNRKIKNKGSANVETVVQLALNDDTAFIPLFKQVFPAFYDKLLEINPTMSMEEFKFCAQLKLGFSTKEIAMQSHLAIRTVQTKKNRLRKSFNIASDIDLYAWVDSL